MGQWEIFVGFNVRRVIDIKKQGSSANHIIFIFSDFYAVSTILPTMPTVQVERDQLFKALGKEYSKYFHV